MTRHGESLDPDYFENMFRGTDDPWDLETSAYEREKYDHTIRALGARRYARGFEIGCAKGVLTERLAPLCAALLAIDVSETALTAARARCAALTQVSFEQMAFPRQGPSDTGFDLIMLSEVAYYWNDRDLARAAAWIAAHGAPGGEILLVHWTGETDYPQSGDDAVAKLRALLPGVEVSTAERCPNYRLDLWRIQP